MTQIKSLKNIGFDELYEAFSQAFIDYDIQIGRSELADMLKRRGNIPELSFGAFEDGQLVSFTFNGIGEFNGIKTAYDTGTGTIKEKRGKGLAKSIFEYSVPFLKEAGIQQYLLEVLQHNTKAVTLYQKQGFKVSREFNYYVDSAKNLKWETIDRTNHLKIEELAGLPDSDFLKSWDFNPSWQNSNDSILRDMNKFKFLTACMNEVSAGYLIFEPGSGDITQLGVLPGFRRKGIASKLLNHTIENYKLEKLKVINVETTCTPMVHFLSAVGFKLNGKQFEMIKKL